MKSVIARIIQIISELKNDMVIQVAAIVHSLRFIVINNPVMLVNDVLKKVLITWSHVHHEEPLVGKRIKVHLMSHGPVIE
jgi:ssDNA-specific exonuclease RecJ